MTASIGLAALAGIVSILSPCVLPLVPIVLGTSASEHRYGPIALAVGLALSFTATGLFLATIGFSIGLNADLFRYTAAVFMIAIGAVMAVGVLQQRFATLTGPLANAAEQRLGKTTGSGLAGQFSIGALLGVVWSPCVGPTLGAAALLASLGEDLPSVALTMLAFGIGAALPLLLIGTLSRKVLTRWRESMAASGSGIKRVMGLIMMLIGLLILSGFDKTVETALVEISPDWLVMLTTRF